VANEGTSGCRQLVHRPEPPRVLLDRRAWRGPSEQREPRSRPVQSEQPELHSRLGQSELPERLSPPVQSEQPELHSRLGQSEQRELHRRPVQSELSAPHARPAGRGGHHRATPGGVCAGTASVAPRYS
jgi:hypothetical protein